MEIATTRTYYFTADEMRIIYKFCQIADDIAISEGMDYDNQNYSAENLFIKNIKNILKLVKLVLPLG